MPDETSPRGPLSIIVYTTSWCPDCMDAQRVLKRSGLPYQSIDVEEAPGAEAAMQTASNGSRKVPVIVIEHCGNTTVLIEPTIIELEAALKLIKSNGE